MENIEHLSSDNYRHRVDIWYRTYNISREKLNLFHDFLISLYELIENTYMGSDIMVNNIDQKNHFDWCWNKTIENFTKEKIYFKERGILYEHFWEFFLDAFYLTKIKNDPIRITEFFRILFDLSHIKTNSELEIMTEIYRLFDQNLKR